MGILQRMRGMLVSAPPTLAALGVSALAVRVADGVAPPAACAVLYIGAGGQARVASGRAAAAPVACRDGEAAWLVSPASCRCALAPFPAAPELGLQLDFCFDAVGGAQRFALYLAGELAGAETQLALAAIGADMQEAVQGALQQGMLELPPCTSDEEWHAFRAGLNELVFARFGLIVEDCVPVDLHPGADFAAQLAASAAERPADSAVAFAAAPTGRAAAPQGQAAVAPPVMPSAGLEAQSRATAPAVPEVAPPAPPLAARTGAAAAGPNAAPADDHPPGQPPAPPEGPASEPGLAHLTALLAGVARAHRPHRAAGDAASLRRLFLELPALAAGFRALPLEEGAGQFAPLQDILRRIQLAILGVNTMPALEVSAPGEQLSAHRRQSRAAHSAAAQAALDEAWSLLAVMRSTGVNARQLEEAARILSNLEFSLAHRRAVGKEPA